MSISDYGVRIPNNPLGELKAKQFIERLEREQILTTSGMKKLAQEMGVELIKLSKIRPESVPDSLIDDFGISFGTGDLAGLLFGDFSPQSCDEACDCAFCSYVRDLSNGLDEEVEIDDEEDLFNDNLNKLHNLLHRMKAVEINSRELLNMTRENEVTIIPTRYEEKFMVATVDWTGEEPKTKIHKNVGSEAVLQIIMDLQISGRTNVRRI